MSEQGYRVPDLAPGQYHVVEDVIHRSRFIATIARVSSPERAKVFIDSIRAKYSNATHNCWAYVAGPAGDTAQVGASDDGEPKGTAGRPMLTALLHSGVGQVAVVVTRYFGGILLGTGGLVRAYQGTTKLGLESLPTTRMTQGVRLLISVDPSLASWLEYRIGQSGGRILSSDFRWDASYEIEVDEKQIPALESDIMNRSSGTARIEHLDRQE